MVCVWMVPLGRLVLDCTGTLVGFGQKKNWTRLWGGRGRHWSGRRPSTLED